MPDAPDALTPDDEIVNAGCLHTELELTALREWAWERGRTDLVLTLDLHSRGWAFQADPSPGNLRRLAAIIPPRGRLEARLRRVATTGGSPREAIELSCALRGWCESSCALVDAALGEMRAAIGSL